MTGQVALPATARSLVRGLLGPAPWQREATGSSLRGVAAAWMRWSTTLAVLGLLAVTNLVGVVGVVAHAMSQGALTDWSTLAKVDPAQPYAMPGFFRWAPIAAVGWQYIVVPLGFWTWAALHLAALVAIRNRVVLLAGLLAWPFWDDVLSGGVITFVVAAAILGLRGSKGAMAAYVALFALMPRPVMLPVLAVFVWRSAVARWTLGAGILIVAASAALMGQLGVWIGRLLATAPDEIASIHNLAPSAVIGWWWLPIGATLALYLMRGRRWGLASLMASPYWLGYYLLFGLLEFAPSASLGHQHATEATRAAAAPAAIGVAA